MRSKRLQKPYQIVLEYPGGLTRRVIVRASSREVAESRALKRNPSATGVKQNG